GAVRRSHGTPRAHRSRRERSIRRSDAEVAALLGEIRLHGGDLGVHFYESNVRDAIYALWACRGNAEQHHVRDRLLKRLCALRDDLPYRARRLSERGGPETLLHGDLWTINIFVGQATGG